ncbi:ClpP/crotonase-like domain-containing protein [Cladochytrium replicatum]|nr:ClpP/crotonase-like domain-containing protein [Cladochytrium replicatum]
MAPPVLKFIECSLTKEGVAIIAFNRPDKANAVNPQMYDEWRDAMRWAAKDDDVIVAVITGKGRFFCAGQELGAPDPNESDDMETLLKARIQVASDVVDEFIKFPKLLIGAANGPTIGIGCTTLALCDVIYSVPHATFNTPFMELGFCAEGTSSLMFPRIMGNAKANEILLLGRKCTAKEFEEWGFISRILPADSFLEQVLEIATRAASLPRNAVLQTKNLVKVTMQDELLAANRREMKLLTERMMSEETMNAIANFLMKKASGKSKL